MAWKETCAVDQRMRLVIEWELEEEPIAALCHKYGISRRVAWRPLFAAMLWLARQGHHDISGSHDELIAAGFTRGYHQARDGDYPIRIA